MTPGPGRGNKDIRGKAPAWGPPPPKKERSNTMVEVKFTSKELDNILTTLRHADASWMTSDLWAKLETAYDDAVKTEIAEQFRE